MTELFRVSFRAFLPCVRPSLYIIRALLKLKIRAKNGVLDPVHSRKIDLRREKNVPVLKLSIIFLHDWNFDFFSHTAEIMKESIVSRWRVLLINSKIFLLPGKPAVFGCSSTTKSYPLSLVKRQSFMNPTIWVDVSSERSIQRQAVKPTERRES